jgi:hypothetical protein
LAIVSHATATTTAIGEYPASDRDRQALQDDVTAGTTAGTSEHTEHRVAKLSTLSTATSSIDCPAHRDFAATSDQCGRAACTARTWGAGEVWCRTSTSYENGNDRWISRLATADAAATVGRRASAGTAGGRKPRAATTNRTNPVA